MLENTIELNVIFGPARRPFEALSRGALYLHSAPILANKMNPHHFDDERTWKEGASRRERRWQYP